MAESGCEGEELVGAVSGWEGEDEVAVIVCVWELPLGAASQEQVSEVICDVHLNEMDQTVVGSPSPP